VRRPSEAIRCGASEQRVVAVQLRLAARQLQEFARPVGVRSCRLGNGRTEGLTGNGRTEGLTEVTHRDRHTTRSDGLAGTDELAKPRG
jgi:hypothetical protein